MLVNIRKADESCSPGHFRYDGSRLGRAPGLIPTPGDVLEFELEKGKLESPVEVSCSTTSEPSRSQWPWRDDWMRLVLPFVLRKKDGTINFTAINVTLATPHAPCSSRWDLTCLQAVKLLLITQDHTPNLVYETLPMLESVPKSP